MRKLSKVKRSKNSKDHLAEEHAKYFGVMSDVEAKDVDWLWYPYIPYHGLTLIAGEPSQGKSFLTMELAAVISNQKYWPFSEERPHGNRILILSAEDDDERAIAPRLDRIGASRESIRYMKLYRKLDQKCLELLRYEIDHFRPEAVIVDTISAYMGADTDMNKQVEVQDFLIQLTAIARKHGLAIVIIAHLNKKVGESATHRINGSIGFVAGVRSVIIIGEDPDDGTRKAFSHAKSNWGPKGQTLIFTLEGGDRKTLPELKWVGTSDLSADVVCKNTKNPASRPKNERNAACQFILDFLEDAGATNWEEIKRAGARKGHTLSTLVRARKELANERKIEQRQKGKSVIWGLVTSEGAQE